MTATYHQFIIFKFALIFKFNFEFFRIEDSTLYFFHFLLVNR